MTCWSHSVQPQSLIFGRREKTKKKKYWNWVLDAHASCNSMLRGWNAFLWRLKSHFYIWPWFALEKKLTRITILWLGSSLIAYKIACHPNDGFQNENWHSWARADANSLHIFEFSIQCEILLANFLPRYSTGMSLPYRIDEIHFQRNRKCCRQIQKKEEKTFRAFNDGRGHTMSISHRRLIHSNSNKAWA